MSYQSARKNFAENIQLIGPQPMDDPLNWNLNNGLINLTNAIQQDLAEMNQRLKQVSAFLAQRR
jgi:hypothetical protein